MVIHLGDMTNELKPLLRSGVVGRGKPSKVGEDENIALGAPSFPFHPASTGPERSELEVTLSSFSTSPQVITQESKTRGHYARYRHHLLLLPPHTDSAPVILSNASQMTLFSPHFFPLRKKTVRLKKINSRA